MRVIGVLLFVFALGCFYYLALFEPSKDRPTSEALSISKKVVSPKKTIKNEGKETKLSLIAVGDVMMARSVGAMIKVKGADEPFRLVSSILKKADLTVANLESPLSSKGAALIGKDVVFRGEPSGAQGIKNSGIDAVSLANNHALDYGPEALQETIGLLDKNGLRHAGAGLNLTDAIRPAYLKTGGKKVSFLAYSYILPNRFYPTETKAGVAPARADVENILSQIKMAKKKSDLLVIYFHWGAEYQDYPLRYQRELAHKSIDAGADLVLGAHPHVIQGLEVYKKKLIAYSLGDFVFDHYSRKTGETFVLRVNLSSKNGTLKAEIIPVYITASGQPTLVYGKEAGSILTRLLKISEIFGTQLVIEGDRAKLTFDAEK